MTSGSLKMVAWEMTRNCNLACIHCRASASLGPFAGELTNEECLRLIDEIAAFSRPVVILTGGEPLLRPDIFRIASYGNKKGLRMVMAVNGTLVNEETARKIITAGIKRISISLDGAIARTHDRFRQVEGAFQSALSGINAAKSAGLEFQVNTTITKRNIDELPELLKLAEKLGAAGHHIFLLVPMGRGEQLKDEEISAGEYEKTLNWFYRQSQQTKLELKATCAPHYYRILAQHQAAGLKGRTQADLSRPAQVAPGKIAAGIRRDIRGTRSAPEKKAAGSQAVTVSNMRSHPLHTVSRGCLGGVSFCFISHVGQVQPCGYLGLNCGNIRQQGFRQIWQDAAIFNQLRDFSNYKGKCGYCKYKEICGGCRARAYAKSGDYLEEEPYCLYQPRR